MLGQSVINGRLIQMVLQEVLPTHRKSMIGLMGAFMTNRIFIGRERKWIGRQDPQVDV